MNQTRPWVSLLTPSAPSGIAVISLRGSGSAKIIHRFFRPARTRKGKPYSPSRVLYGTLCDGDRDLDEVLVIPLGAGNRKGFEICCHGGEQAAATILSALADAGAEVRPWYCLIGSGTLRHDLLAALLGAQGPTQAAILAHLSSGCLEKTFRFLAQSIGPPESRISQSERNRADALAKRLEASFGFGRFLRHPPKVVIRGPANVGKSTLFNAILGERRALTSKIPGTTRDPVEAAFLLEGFPVRLFDLPGEAAKARSPLDACAGAEAERLVLDSDLRLHVEDASFRNCSIRTTRLMNWHGTDEGGGKAVKIIDILNKMDLCRSKDRVVVPIGLDTGEGAPLGVSALKEEGIGCLLGRMAETLGLYRLLKNLEPLLFDKKQVAFIRKIRVILGGEKAERTFLDRLSIYLEGQEITG